MADIPISLQLYSIRDYTGSDFAGAVQQVADIGYTHVELAGFGNLKTAEEARAALDDAGLKVSGAHVAMDRWKDPEAMFDEADVLGNENLVIPWLAPESRTAEGYRQLGQLLAKAAAAGRKRGKRVAYHNHEFELQPLSGANGQQCGLDLLWSSTPADAVFAELDLFWLKVADVDPLAYLRRIGDRALLLHLKDQSKSDPRKFAEVGTGTLDFPAIMRAASSLNVRYAVVEQDDCYGTDSMQVARTCFENLQGMGLA